MIRVLLADDEVMMRAGARAILSADPEIEVVAEAADGRQAVELVHRHRPDVALLDVQMPHLNGLDAASAILRSDTPTAVIILTTFSNDDYISRALSDGASGFLLKSGDPRELIAGVRAVADGAAYLSPEAARRVIRGLPSSRTAGQQAAREQISKLSGREQEVLGLLGAGLSNAQIARRLHLVEGTVKTHVSSIFTRLAVGNRVQAAIIAHEAGLIEEAKGR
ncbi:response regulator transcription factor [Streptomyces sp. NBC_00385]|uniref:response regulator transcription factor n=1 Tax=Streptomyces sp. NBC_00385 TaxID=2975733 RepID=UPI002DD8B31F|nr:response regulator transcription factor [Streptomyces sp. NBC_00385]WRZ04762.1 response regulator transcription factor [Streptomyces sp. NBC_00385]